MHILGISAYYHDSAAVLLKNGDIIAAAQEERFTRKKHDAAFPTNAIDYCLSVAGITHDNIDYVAFYDKPFLKFERLMETYMAFAPKGFQSFQLAVPIWIKEKLFQKRLLLKELKKKSPKIDWDRKLLFAEHHQSHAASAFYPSPFDEAVILTMDGVGEWTTTSAGIGRGNELQIIKEIHFPHSLGLLYSAFTYYIGFKVNSGEYKLMGLAPYGRPTYVNTIYDHLIDVKDDGSFRLNMEYFDYCTGLRMTNDKFNQLFGGPARLSEGTLTQREMDIAASIQKVTEDIVLKMTRSLAAETGLENLCLAGGVALNCVANGKIARDGAFKNIWIQPAAGDAGGALGAATAAYHNFLQQPRTKSNGKDRMHGAYLGIGFTQDEIESRLQNLNAKFHVLNDDALIETSADILKDGQAMGWFQGRMEFGPRALGGRSILGDPRSQTMQSVLNLKVKFRESFRPFAPSVLAEDVHNWFEMSEDSPYMLLVANVKEEKCREMTDAEMQLFGIDKLNISRSEIPAVTHVDYSARVQTVHKETNPKYHALIDSFKSKTGCPVIVNTSFNIRGEPIVCTPDDAFRCFMGTDIEALVVGNCLLYKHEQDASLIKDYRNQFQLD